MPTREQLQSIEWAVPNAFGAAVTCPACYGTKDYNGHHVDCWLAAALASPPTDETLQRLERMRGKMPDEEIDAYKNILKAAQAPPPDDAEVDDEVVVVQPHTVRAWRPGTAPPPDSVPHTLRWQPALFGKMSAHCSCGAACPDKTPEMVHQWFAAHSAAQAPPPDETRENDGLLSRGQARAIHIMTNVAHARNGRVLFACDGPDCPICMDLTLLKLPRALSRLAAQAPPPDPPGLPCVGEFVDGGVRLCRECGPGHVERCQRAARPADPPGLVELVREWQAAKAAHDHMLTQPCDSRAIGDLQARRASYDRVDAAAMAVLAYPLPAPAHPTTEAP